MYGETNVNSDNRTFQADPTGRSGPVASAARVGISWKWCIGGLLGLQPAALGGREQPDFPKSRLGDFGTLRVLAPPDSQEDESFKRGAADGRALVYE